MPKKIEKQLENKPIVLVVIDGFGLTNKKIGNAPKSAKMPNYRLYSRTYPTTKLRADGDAVGLPDYEVGNSEAGHQTIGAGRPIMSDKLIINKAINDGSFYKNTALKQAAEHAKKNKSTLHLMGLLTNSQSAHASIHHILSLVDLMQKLKVKDIALHIFTDGRDTNPYHAIKLLNELESKLPKYVKIATVMGRFYAMDRNHNWDRAKLAYDALVHGIGTKANSATEAIEHAYSRGESDEFVKPTVIKNDHHPLHIKERDAVVFWNLRSDRARQLAKPFISRHFNGKNGTGFTRGKKIPDLLFVTLTEFGKQLDHAISAFTHHEISDTLVEALRTKKQIYIAESEKYAHVTYFFNGGYDSPRFGEYRKRIQSHHVKTFDQVPGMRAKEIALAVAASVNKGYDFVCTNIANPDMVAHTGNFSATVKACEAVDVALGVIVDAVQKADGICIITADHGNAEEVIEKNGSSDTHHNANPVPFILIGKSVKNKRLSRGTLADIAPTILNLMGVPIPKSMTGKNLVRN
ncbi:MAG: 2,3-bisphosphoglycerate-independent phosphoglycerate mutase [Patescibacteria group bacterium]|nr:2,3-bisphosphoglycerate-independent phosphoglycerate mutase [Patescibacteria group bacterium]